jgi:Bifunctional DNA primase/polymerase, N-terminal/AAA domain
MSEDSTTRTRVEWALDALTRGPVVPLKPNSKAPRWGGWRMRALRTEEEVREHWAANPDDNIGTMCTDCVVLDIDRKHDARGKESYEWLKDSGYEFPPTFKVLTTSGGAHFYYRNPGNVGTLLGFLNGLDRKSVAGSEAHQVVAPGSTIDGKAYTVYADLPVADPPKWLLDDELLTGWHREWVRTTRSEEAYVPKADSEYVGRTSILKVEADYLYECIERSLHKALPTWTPEEERLPKIPRHVHHDELYSIFSWLWNKRVWSEKSWWSACEAADDLVGAGHRLHDSMDFKNMVLDVSRYDQPEEKEWPKPVPATEEERTFWNTDKTVTLGSKTFPILGLPFYDRDTDLATPSKEWWWNGRISHPASVIWHGPSGVGKSSIVVGLLDAAFSGDTDFLGEPLGGLGSVRALYMEEEGPIEMKMKLDRLGWPGDRCKAISVDDMYGVEWLQLMLSVLNAAEENGYNLVVVDTLSLWVRGEGGGRPDLYEFANLLKPIFSHAMRSGISIWALHHDGVGRKDIYGGNEVLAPFQHAVAHTYDNNTELDKLRFYKRYFDRPRPSPIFYHYDEHTGERHPAGTSPNVSNGSYQSSMADRNLRLVLDSLAKAYPNWLTKDELTGHTAMGEKTLDKWLKVAVTQFEAEVDPRMGRGNKSRWRYSG